MDAELSVQCIGIRIERTSSTPSPKHERFIATLTAQGCRAFDQEPEDHRTIIVDKFDETGFGDEAAKLD